MGGKLLRNLKQIGTICFVVSCFCFPNFSWANCTDDTYRMKFEDGNWLYQKCTGGNWVSDQSPGHYSCGAGTKIPDSTNDAKIWSGKIWDDDQNLYTYWRGPGKKLDSEGFALTKDVCVGCARDEYYDTEEDKCKKSVYAPPCDTTQSAGQSCTFNDGAASAICKDIGFKSDDESVLTCVAQTCKKGYLLKLSTKRNGKSDGRCYTIERANETCPAKPNDCNGEWGLKLYPNPNTNEDGKAYKPGDCECKTQSSSANDISADTYCEQNNVSKNAGADKTSASGTNWSVVFDYGTMTGKSLCHTSGSGKIAKGTTSSNGNYCWCALQDEADWVFLEQISNNCSGTCAKKCADKVASDKGFRKSVFYCPEEEKEEKPAEQKPVAPEKKDPQVENAKQVLAGFFNSAYSTANVWKNEEGKFNTARLASDLGAAVVLGTVGGVVSGTVIKKKQIKKGFESLQCYIGGRAMAGWGDTFNVDLAR